MYDVLETTIDMYHIDNHTIVELNREGSRSKQYLLWGVLLLETTGFRMPLEAETPEPPPLCPRGAKHTLRPRVVVYLLTTLPLPCNCPCQYPDTPLSMSLSMPLFMPLPLSTRLRMPLEAETPEPPPLCPRGAKQTLRPWETRGRAAHHLDKDASRSRSPGTTRPNAHGARSSASAVGKKGERRAFTSEQKG